MKRGILVVSFGTTYRETREKNIDRLVETVREAFPDRPVVCTFSSRLVQKILRERDGLAYPDPKEALCALCKDGVQEVTVLPTYVIDGIENHRLKQDIAACRGLFWRIRTADVLLAGERDIVRVAEELWNAVGERAGTDPVIFMGHGSTHEADVCYEKLERALNACAPNGIYLATVEGRIGIEEVIGRLKRHKPEGGRVLLTPFMLVAGDHAVCDMAGERDSFAKKLTRAGYEPECLLRGIGEYEGIRKLYLERLKRAEGSRKES